VKKRILVIDDSEIMLARIQRALAASGDGYEVTTTAQAVGNTRHVANADLVIVDFHMPGINGGTVIASLREAASALGQPCLFYLYTTDAAIAAAYARLGFDGALTDKGNEDALVRQVRAVFRMIQMRAMAKGKRA
jgi:DNA-binding NarL/FixJ family response regulator